MKNHPSVHTGALHSRMGVLLVTTPGQCLFRHRGVNNDAIQIGLLHRRDGHGRLDRGLQKHFYAGLTHSKLDQTPLQDHQQAVQSRGAFEPDKQHLRFNRIWMVANNESSASSLGQKSAR